RDRYVPATKWVMVPGARLFPTPTGTRARFEIIVAGEYGLEAASGNALAPSIELRVDGRVLPSTQRVPLQPGWHEAGVSGTSQDLFLCLSTPIDISRELQERAEPPLFARQD